MKSTSTPTQLDGYQSRCGESCRRPLLTYRRCWMLVVGLVGCLINDQVIANPTSKNPNVPLAVHGTVAEAKQIHAKLSTLIVETEKFIEETLESISKRGPEAAPPKKLSFYRGNAAQALYETQRLAALGEPAAIDFQLRFLHAQMVIQEMVKNYMLSPVGQKMRANLIAQVKKTQPAREKKLAQVRENLEKGNVSGAESVMDPLTIEVEGLIHFLYPDEYKPYIGTYDPTRAALHEAAIAKRVAEAKNAFAVAIANNAVDLNAFKEWINQVATQISTAGQATIPGAASLDGPACVESVKAQWLAAHARLQRQAGLYYAFSAGDSNKLAELGAIATGYQTAALDGISRIIEADATSLASTDVQGRYLRYLSSLAELSNLSEASSIESGSAAALKKLLAKNLKFLQQVEQYQQATRDMLEFDKRARAQAVAAQQAKFPAADLSVRKQVEVVNQQPGLLPTQTTVPMLATLMSPAHLTMASVGPRLVGQSISLQRIRALTPDAKIEVAGLDSRTYGSMLKVSLPPEEQTRIASLLLVDTSHPPLSMAASSAMQNILRGNFDAGGGQIVSCQLEPVVARFAAMTDAASTIVPLGAVGAASVGPMQLNQMMMRVDVMPQWVTYPLGSYWLANVPATPATAPNAVPVAPNAVPTAPPTVSPPSSGSEAVIAPTNTLPQVEPSP